MSRAVVFDAYGGPEVLRVAEVPEPVPGPGRIRVRVRAAGVNPIDAKVRGGRLAGRFPVAFPQTLGNEFAGVVDQLGPGVTELPLGAEVFGFTSMAAQADHVVVGVDQVTARPADLPWATAAALSAVGQTAYHALRILAPVRGETLLVHAAAGGVGTVAVQLARALGVTVIGTASEGNHDYLRSLGAIPVAYGPGLTERVRGLAPGGVDAALDCVGGDAVRVSLDLVADRRRIGTVADETAAERYGVQRVRYDRSAATLAELARLHGTGGLVLPIARTFPLDAVAAAHREIETGHVRGKLVLLLTDGSA
ncbi:NADP-dependent oxidoreductase [Streptacidiphilus sp. P02-A3a]|uniref:NADP-dependent oxidoreductase n=1 Tax=Streptacidiphilus sp. P02-A3a TaxID=2704468 RepID=UPI0015FAF93C|nr:NADP-dependent oxidoreductase [Streptacidiphilus sp. P02-A3a]QMU68780.1 NADP-dependent oxidoreductase [Streptacidiphilus sp. P02-A3a]